MARIGIVGSGWGARVQVPLFREAGLEVVAVAARDPERTAKVARELGLEAHESWQALVRRDDLDLISVVTPPSTHVEIGREVLRTGKHLLCEKPMAVSAREAEELVKLASARPSQLALIDHELRFLPAWRAARERFAGIGSLRFVEVRFCSPSRGDRNRRWNWWSDAAQGGGVWGAVGSHFVDAIRYVSGEEIVAAQGVMNTFVDERPFEDGWRNVTSDDFAAVNLRLGSGALAVMSFSVVSGVDEPSTLTFHGDGGVLRLVDEELLFARNGEAWERVVADPLAPRPGNSPGGAFGTGTLLLGGALVEALDRGRRDALAVAATVADGLAHQKVLDAARESHRREGVWIAC
jgi:predicted dehydrogenase